MKSIIICLIVINLLFISSPACSIIHIWRRNRKIRSRYHINARHVCPELISSELSFFLVLFAVDFTWKLVSGLELSGACLLLMASLFSCCYMSCREIDYSKTSYGILIAVVIMLGGMCVGIRLQLNQKQYILNLFKTARFWSKYLIHIHSC